MDSVRGEGDALGGKPQTQNKTKRRPLCTKSLSKAV